MHELGDVIAGAGMAGRGHAFDRSGATGSDHPRNLGWMCSSSCRTVRASLTTTKEPTIAIGRHTIGTQRVGVEGVAGGNVDSTGGTDAPRAGAVCGEVAPHSRDPWGRVTHSDGAAASFC